MGTDGQPLRDSSPSDVALRLVPRRVRAGVVAMSHAVRYGYPAPRLYEIRGQDMFMQRVRGPTMLTALMGGDLDLPAGLPPFWPTFCSACTVCCPRPGAGPGTRLVHLDLHPDNVILSSSGPTVIDWTNARDGSPALDVVLCGR